MLEGRLITGDQREFVIAAWDGVNHSGWQPLDDKVLVLMEEHAEVTSGGIAIPAVARDRQNVAAETGLIVALGPLAFVWNDEGTRAWSGRKPAPGDRVYIDRYSGQLLQGHDGRTYRLMAQRCVGAVAIAVPEATVEQKEKPNGKRIRRVARPAAAGLSV